MRVVLWKSKTILRLWIGNIVRHYLHWHRNAIESGSKKRSTGSKIRSTCRIEYIYAAFDIYHSLCLKEKSKQAHARQAQVHSFY